MKTTFSTNRWSLDVNVEQIEVTSNMPRRDPAWEHTDGQGHNHRYDGSELPTLVWVVDTEDYIVDEGDGYWEEYPGTGHYECRQCGEVIQPGMRPPSMFREYVPGAKTATLTCDGVPYYLTMEQWDDLTRRMSLTRDHSIWNRIIEQFVEAQR